MHKHGNFYYYTFEEVKDELYGKIGTPKRDEYEAEVAEMLRALQLGEAIKTSREEQQITKEQLSERVGVRQAQISMIEKGKNLNFNTLMRIFKALNMSFSLSTSNGNLVAL